MKLGRQGTNRRVNLVAAGAVGVTVLVAAVWIVTSGPSIDRTVTPVVAGPAESGPAESGPTTHNVAGWDGIGLPPKGAVVSTPVEGTTVAEYRALGGRFVYVYADGRVISHANVHRHPEPVVFEERRLTSAGVELVRSGSTSPIQVNTSHIPADAWADPKDRIYVPARYAICNPHNVDPSHIARLLPPRAAALLRGKEKTYEHLAGPGGNISPRNCFEVTTDKARTLVGILTEAGLDGDVEGLVFFVTDPSIAKPISIEFRWLLPQGEWVRCCPG